MNFTREEKRIKIAEACGWKNGGRYSETATFIGWVPPGATRMTPELPSYFTDLNAMHEAVANAYKKQPPGWLLSYEETLTEVCSKRQLPHFNPICAVAEDCAEAFGLTLNLWNPGE